MSSAVKPALPDTTVGDARKVVVPEGSIAYTIRQLRERTGLTQEQFAAKLGVTFPTINRWENGHTNPSPLALRQIENLARGLGEQG
jgi:putative transcriptional regulator